MPGTTHVARRAAGAAALLIAVCMVAAAGGCSKEKRRFAQDTEGRALVGPDAPADRRYALAIQLVMGTTRPQDTLTFGEWARAAYRQQCPSMSPDQQAFEVYDNFGRVDVNLTFKPGSPGQPEPTCQPTPPTLRIAAVRFNDLVVIDPPATANPNLPEVDWLARFKRGEPLPAR